MGRASAIEVSNDVKQLTQSSLTFKFSKQGARLIMWDVNEEANKETQKILRELGYHDNVTVDFEWALQHLFATFR